MTKRKSFSERLKSSVNLSKLQEQVKKASGGKKDYTDDRFWKPTKDKSGTGTAKIRFLSDLENDPFILYYSYSFKGVGGWFIENCPSTLGYDHPSPVLEDNRRLFETGDPKDEEKARKRSRKKNYVANILVINDPGNPENNGKVFLFRFGPKIFDKIKAKITPAFQDQEPLDIFHPIYGANFSLRVVKNEVSGFDNYDNSEFDMPSPLFGGDEDKIEALIDKMYDLNKFFEELEFKSYDELKARFDLVMNGVSKANRRSRNDDDDDNNEDGDNSEDRNVLDRLRASRALKNEESSKSETRVRVEEPDDDDEDDEALIRRLVEEAAADDDD